MREILILAVVLVAVLIYYYRKNVYLPRKTQREQQRKEILQKLEGQKFVVIIRTKDGKKTALETEVIGALLAHKALVTTIDNGDIEKLLSGQKITFQENTLCLIGKTWTSGSEYKSDHCDFRLLSSSTQVCAAHHVSSRKHYYEELSEVIAYKIASDLRQS